MLLKRGLRTAAIVVAMAVGVDAGRRQASEVVTAATEHPLFSMCRDQVLATCPQCAHDAAMPDFDCLAECVPQSTGVAEECEDVLRGLFHQISECAQRVDLCPECNDDAPQDCRLARWHCVLQSDCLSPFHHDERDSCRDAVATHCACAEGDAICIAQCIAAVPSLNEACGNN